MNNEVDSILILSMLFGIMSISLIYIADTIGIDTKHSKSNADKSKEILDLIVTQDKDEVNID